MSEKMTFGAFVIFAMFSSAFVGGATVTHIDPHYGSLGGETRLTIYGSGFSGDQFSQNDDPEVGNHVYLVADSGRQFTCAVHKDGSTEIQIMCYTPKKMSEENHYVKAVVGGKTVNDTDLCKGDPKSKDCTFKPQSANTPTIDSFYPNSGPPGTMVRWDGQLFTDRYGSNLPAATNKREQKLLRIYVGPTDCGMKDGDDFYGLGLESEESDNGYLICKTKGSSVGFFNASYIVEPPFGRSMIDSMLYRVSRNDVIYLYQTYADITSVSPAMGSTAGGLTLTIYGYYFDGRAPNSRPRAYVGETECVITKLVLDQYIECTVAADPKYSNSKYGGNRGVNYEYWISVTKDSSNIDDVLSMTSSDAGYNSATLDETYHFDTNDTMDNYVSKMTTMFTPPHDGNYQFQLYADDGAKLFVDGSETVTSNKQWAYSTTMTLNKSTKYLLEIIHFESSGESFVHLKAKYFNTTFTSAWTSKANQENQTISITSTVEYDVQKLMFSGFVDRTHVKEVQTVEVDTQGKFRFGLFGVYTEPLELTADDGMVATAFNSLPIFGNGESVTVVSSQTAQTVSFTFTFESERGDFPAIDVIKVAGSSNVNFNATEDIQGSPDMDTVSLSLAGVLSPAISVSAMDATSLESALNSMFEARCPSLFESSNTVYENYEDSSPSYSGERVKDTEPFCGRYSLKNPRRMYIKQTEQGPSLSSYKMLCFAYKGVLKDSIWLSYSYEDTDSGEHVTRRDEYVHTFMKDSVNQSTTWYYTCFNMYDSVENSRPSDTDHRIKEIWVAQGTYDDIYVDSVFIGREETTTDPEINLRRRRPSMPNGALIDTMTVTKSGTNEYTVTLRPFECGNLLPLFELGNGVVSSGSTASPSTSATLKLQNGAEGLVLVSRTSFASPPAIGLIDLTFNGNTRQNLNISLEANEFKKELQSLPGIGFLSVVKVGTCANFDHHVTFLTLPGDLPEMTVIDDNLQGINAHASISTTVTGGLSYDLMGDMLRTVHFKPQVRLDINNVPVACTGNCGFEWHASVTPSITAISPTLGTSALSTSLSITGTGFSSTQSENKVTIGGVACAVTAATATSITCDVGNGPVGAHKVVITVASKGDADHNGNDIMFTYTANITSISPITGGLGGGNVLTLTGYGFKSGANVTINSATCDVTNVTADKILCTMPAMSAGTYDVIVEQGSVTLTYSSYIYDLSLTATITSVSPSTISVQGDTITISGSSFGDTTISVYFGSQMAKVVSWSDTEVVVETGSIDPGMKDVKLETTNGFALNGSQSLPVLSVDLMITNVFPLNGSLQGGTKLTITGVGFGNNDTIVNVTVGDVPCNISTLTNTRIECMVAQAGKTHKVTNKGTDPAYGVFYAFDDPYIIINKGDFVDWKWETPPFIYDIEHEIIEVDDASAVGQKLNGISSGTPSKNGNYRYQFTQTGTYYVWSGYVDIWNIKNYVGTIEVVEASSYLREISVKVSGKEALHTIGGASDPVDGSVCQSVMSAKSGCTEALPSGGDSSKFNFAFLTCSTPMVDKIDKTNGTVKTTITVTGNGLSSAGCQNEISIGNYTCDVTSSSSTSVTCNMAKAGEPELGVLHPFSVRVGNRGYALMNVRSLADRSFGLFPNIESILPASGSKAGGAVLTISGFGFGDSPLVYIGGYTCLVITSSYTKITCETPACAVCGQPTKNVDVQAIVNGNPLQAICEMAHQKCTYKYSSSLTPSISDISPSSMSGSTEFTITGKSLGDVIGEVVVTIGGVSATVSSVADKKIVAIIQNVPAGNNDVVVNVNDYGKASGSLVVYGIGVISTVTPSSGSIYGNTLITLQGNGFVDGQTTVTLDGATCDVTSVTLSQVTCLTGVHAAGIVSLDVTSNAVSYNTSSFDYNTGSTPTVTSISPLSGLTGGTLNITGTNLAGGAITILLDGVPCNMTSGSATEIQCTIGAHATGSVPVYVHVEDLGASNIDVKFEYQLSLTSILPLQGGTAGSQTVVLTGTGFDNTALVTICGLACQLVATTSMEYTCKTPANTGQVCAVAITISDLTKTLPNSYTYNAALTPSVTSVTPTRGGTGGGSTITVTGSGFGVTLGSVSVTIDGTVCVAASVIDTQIECVTGAHQGSIETTVNVEIAGNGIAAEATPGDSNFHYIDVWSSPFTWGNGSLPQAGEFIVIPAGMTLLLDTDTPVLKFLLIQGGQLIFDEKDVELQSEIIMITDGGLLQVGTEAAPFQHKAIITMHGHHRSKELPIYGTKVLAVRNGTLDLHGIEVPLTWTRLASTSAAGSSKLQLVDPVEWNVGDEIVIASTGNHHSQSENEKKTITAISLSKQTLTLDSALAADHYGEEETFDGTLVEFRAEVGLLTHNVLFRGNTEPLWTEEIKACEAGFDTGEFATQTCFQGRFGDEIGSSQFGAMILAHAPVKDTHEAVARISYTEVTFAGQAFRLGRYPIHFHLNGDMSTSYVRGCGIHHTFNRAVNIHGTHNTMVEKTVIYNIMGGAFFLEDGIETGNTFQYNLAVFVRESSSLLNDDITPASFWVTNPNNTIQHNAAAGGTHFGFWYRMHDHPDGPSFTPDVCCKNVPLGIFQNNTAHSFGWFGLWIFEDYFPLKGSCGGTEVEPAVFRSLTSWNNDKGAEAVNSGALQFVDFVLVQNRLAGYEGKKVLDVPHFTDDSPMLKNSLIVGKTTVIPDSTQDCTDGGIVLPYGSGFRVKNVRFVNFADSSCAAFRWARIDGTCILFCGGYNYHVEGLSFINAPNKAVYAWDWEGILVDKDGSATGKSENDWKIVPTTGSLPSDCEPAPEYSIGEPASFCPPAHKFHRYAFNNPIPKSLDGKNFLIKNQYGTSVVPYAKKRLSHKLGWMCALLDGETYSFEFEFADQITNISYTGAFYEFEPTDWISIKFAVKELPDRFSFDSGKTFINATVGLNPATAMNGDWEWDNVHNEINFLVHGTKRSKRSMSMSDIDRSLSFTTYKCFFDDCIPPPDPDNNPPAQERPLDFLYWDDTSLWNDTGDGYVTSDPGRNGTYGIPQDLDNVRIAFGEWVVVNMTSIAKLGTLLLEGTLELIDMPGAVYELNADLIIIMGGRLVVGWPDSPFEAQASIILRGNHSSPIYPIGDGPEVGSKAIGVFGGLDLFGKDVGVPWTQLSATANAGANQIVVAEAVSWSAGDEIVLGPTTFDVWQTETFKITAVESDKMTLTLNGTLKYKHISYSEIINGETVEFAAGVGLLTRNIKIVGEDYPGLYEESFGARVIVGLISTGTNTYTGYARLSNVEFYHTGQEGFTEDYDPRFSVAYVATGTVSDVKPSFVTKCAFHNGFNSAVGAFGIGSLNITDNVVHHTVGNAMRTSADDTRLIHNMVALVVWTGSYQSRSEPFNFRWEAGVEAMEAKRLILQDNLVTGSERFAYHVAPLACGDTSGSYSNNRAQANLYGVGILPKDKLGVQCALYTGFKLYKNHDFGIYYQNTPSAKFDRNMLVDNRNGIFTMVVEPSAVSHLKEDKTVEITNTLVVGASPTFDCANDVSPTDENMALSGFGRSKMAPTGGMIGVVFPTFNQASNNAPEKPFAGIMAYNSIAGLGLLENVTFAHFGTACKGDFAVSTNVNNDDGQHPLNSRGITLVDVDQDYQILFFRPNVGKINSADCVDMDCDGLKKALFKDLDGSFMGAPGTVVPQSEWEWGGDPRRGLGDNRIPKEMVTDRDGARIPYADIAPNKGIIRSNNCTYMSVWQAYKCFEYNYELLIIESMDEDTETRRLSPVAILGNGYVDLINGPQDHGWCSGYTCRKRLSTFMAVVATGFDYLMHFTGTTPLHLRYNLLRSDPNDGIKLTVWYSRHNRLDVYVDGTFVLATNARIVNGNYILDMPQGNEFTPMIANGTGTNFVDRDTGLHTIIIRGPQVIDVKTKDVIIVSFSLPAMNVESFFGDNIIENVAAFLNIPLTKVRIASVVSASAKFGRRRRSSDGVVVEVEIGDEPASTLNGTVSNSVEYNSLLDYASEIVNECQVGNVLQNFNVSGTCNSVLVPSTESSAAPIVYSTPVPVELGLTVAPVPIYEGVALGTQPKVQAKDISGVVVTELGTAEYPWQLTASLREGTGHPNAFLDGTLTVSSADGWMNFTDLSISHMGTGYILDFYVTFPTSAENFTLASVPFDVAGRPLKASVFEMTSGDIVINSQFAVTLDLRDKNTDEIITDISWRGHTFAVTCGLVMIRNSSELAGNFNKTFDDTTGRAFFDDLSFSSYGLTYIAFRIQSTPEEFDFYAYHKVLVLGEHQVGITVEKTETVILKFDADFKTTLPTPAAEAQLHQAVLQNLEAKDAFSGAIIRTSTCYEGSIMVSFTMEGQSANVTSALETLCSDISAGNTITVGSATLTMDGYMTVDGEDYYSTCGSSSSDKHKGLHPGYIALIVVLCVILVATIILILIWKFKISPNAKTHELEKRDKYSEVEHVEDEKEDTDNGRTVFLAGPNQKVAEIFNNKQVVSTGLRPVTAAPNTTLYDENVGPGGMRKSPSSNEAVLYKERSMMMTPASH